MILASDYIMLSGSYVIQLKIDPVAIFVPGIKVRQAFEVSNKRSINSPADKKARTLRSSAGRII